MKISSFSAKPGLLVIGGTAILLIAAFAHFVPNADSTSVANQPTPVSDSANNSDEASDEFVLPPNFPSTLAQIIKLTKAGIRQDIVLAYITNSGDRYSPTADEIVFLHQAGVSPDVVAALVGRRVPESDFDLPETNAQLAAYTPIAPPAPLMPAVVRDTPIPRQPEDLVLPPSPNPGDAEAAYFHDGLAPYGNWVDTPDNGWCWQPTVEQAVSGWTPYRDGGQWQYTDAGWYWQSEYPWGGVPFHYGRWWSAPALGWVWKPDSRWAPAWVTWRQSDTHYGWAPLPPGVSLNVLFALHYGDRATFNDSSFGLTASSFTFVSADHFLSPNLAKHAIPAAKVSAMLAQAKPLPGLGLASDRIRNSGIDPKLVAAANHTRIKPIPLSESHDLPATRADNQTALIPSGRHRFLPSETAMAAATPNQSRPDPDASAFHHQPSVITGSFSGGERNDEEASPPPRTRWHAAPMPLRVTGNESAWEAAPTAPRHPFAQEQPGNTYAPGLPEHFHAPNIPIAGNDASRSATSASSRASSTSSTSASSTTSKSK